MLDRNAVRKLLAPFDVRLSEDALDKLLKYLALLLRWNQKINLTAIRSPEECVTRHFGESFFLSHAVPLRGRLLDVGSGAGFPGLALKLLCPDLEVVLLEPAAKKRTFLKEVARSCGMAALQVQAARLEELAKAPPAQLFDLVTVRAVGGLKSLLPAATTLLRPNGYLCLWVGAQQVGQVRALKPELKWRDSVSIPLSLTRCILVGEFREDSSW